MFINRINGTGECSCRGRTEFLLGSDDLFGSFVFFVRPLIECCSLSVIVSIRKCIVYGHLFAHFMIVSIKFQVRNSRSRIGKFANGKRGSGRDSVESLVSGSDLKVGEGHIFASVVGVPCGKTNAEP